MSNVKAAGVAIEPAASAEKELLPVRQPIGEKAGEALIQEMSRTIAGQREKTQESRKDEDPEQPKDTAEISETRRWFFESQTVSPGQLLRWVLEMEEELWESFLEWQPDPYAALSKQLQELSRLYLALLGSALKYAEGENLTQQLARLDSLLAQKLNLLMDLNLEQLTVLLEKTGQTAELDSIRSSLYRQTAGQTISPQSAHVLFTPRTPGGSKSAGLFTAPSSFSREGMIYQSSGKQNIRFQQAYHTQQSSWKEQIRQRNQVIISARKGIVENTFRQGGFSSCSGKELERANRFAAHIDGSGNLFKNPAITARNPEVTGLLAAVMSIKGQVYAEKSQDSGFFAFPLENAIEKIIRQYVNQKEASQIYYHTLAAYKQTKDPQKAIQDGRDYAYQQFREKQKASGHGKPPHYSKESGFFRALLKNLSPEKEFSMGIPILQKDWQNFLFAIGSRQNPSKLPEINAYSPWGFLAGAGSHRIGMSGNMGKILFGTAVAVIIGVLAVVCFRFL